MYVDEYFLLYYLYLNVYKAMLHLSFDEDETYTGCKTVTSEIWSCLGKIAAIPNFENELTIVKVIGHMGK